MDDAAAIETCVLAAWPAEEVVAEQGWLLRFAHGVTRRANSVWPNGGPAGGWSEAGLAAALARAEAFYRARGVPPRLQMTPAAQPAGLDALLAGRGYVVEARTAVQTARVGEVAARMGDAPLFQIDYVNKLTDGWVARHAGLVGMDRTAAARRGEIMGRIRVPAAWWTAWVGGEPAGVALTVAGDDWCGLFNMAVDPALRRRGIGRALLRAAAGWAAAQGSGRMYLQVVADNAPARALYARAGFATAYHYHYRSLLSD